MLGCQVVSSAPLDAFSAAMCWRAIGFVQSVPRLQKFW